MSHEVVIERVYTIPFFPKLNSIPRTKRAARAMRLIREYIERHMKSSDILIDPKINEYIFERGMKKPPRRITILARKSDDDVIEVYLADTSLDEFLDTKTVPITGDTEKVVDEEEFEDEEED